VVVTIPLEDVHLSEGWGEHTDCTWSPPNNVNTSVIHA